MSYVKCWLHVVWRTKNNNPCLTKEIRAVLFPHIRDNGKKNGIYVDFINGHFEHVHCLILVNADTSISKTVQLLKGESSHWLNKQKLLPPGFAWADDYFAASISESMIDKVRTYIKNQEQHHTKVTFANEYKKFISVYKLDNQG
jgi:REP element-mobilizing transposase RayT